MQSERVRPHPPLLEPLRSLPLVLTCLFVAVAAVDALMALQPGLLSALRSRWQQAVPIGTSPWATLLAAAVIVGGVAVSATLLAGFIRSVRAAPYLCLAPLWVGSCMLVIGRLPFELPLPVPAPAFIASCALVFVGGGVLFERRAPFWNVLGALLSLLPPGLLALGYGLAPETKFDGNAMLLLAVVVLAAAGAPIIAIASRVNGPRVGPLTADDIVEQEALARQEAFDAQIAELAERMRETEERAVHAERQLAAQPAWQPDVVPRLALSADELTPALIVRRSSWQSWIAPVLLVLGVVVAGAAYVLEYVPLQAELIRKQQDLAMQAEAQSDAIAAVRAGYDRERKALEQQLTEARAALATQAAPQPQAEPAAVASPEEERRAARIAKREAAIAARDARAAEQQTAREQRASEQQAAREQRAADQQAAREQRAAESQAAREQRAAESQATREQRAAEHQAAREQREQRAAERKARAASATSDEAPPAPEAAKPTQPAKPAQRDALDAENDDPLEGL